MQRYARRAGRLALALALAAALPAAAPALAADEASVAAGKKIAFTRKGKTGVGNCLACHVLAGAESPGNMGPPLLAMKQRFPNRADLVARLHDPTTVNPISAMPPFGKHGILTAEEIEKVVDYLYTL